MKLFAASVFALLLVDTPALSQPLPLTLNDIVEVAYGQVEAVKIQQTQTALSVESLRQIEARFYPKLAFLIDYTRIQEPTSSTSSGATSAFTQTNQYDGRLALTVAGIQGYREYYARKAALLDVETQKRLEENVKRLLYIDIVDAYYSLLTARADLTAVELLVQASTDRNREINRLVQLGRSRESDSLQQKTQAALANVSLVEARGVVLAAENRLRLLAGLDKDARIADEEPKIPPALLRLDDYLDSLDARSDIAFLRKQIDISGALVSVARADYLPSLDLKANLHAFRSGILSTSYWDVGFSLNIPIFEGFKTVSAVRTANIALRRNELLLSEAKRVAKQEIQTRYDAAFNLFNAIPVLEEAHTRAGRYYEAVKRDYARKAANNLDVNLALNEFYNVKRRYVQSVNEFKAAYRALLATSGRINESL